MAIVEKVKNLKNGGVVKTYYDDTLPAPVPNKVISDVDFLIDFAEAMEDIKLANNKRLNAIGRVFEYLINKYGKVEITDTINGLLDEVAASPDVPSFDDAKKDKVKG